MNLKTKAVSRTLDRDRRPVLLDRGAEKRKKGLIFEPEAKTYRWIAPRDR